MLYKLVIADDEKNIRDGLRDLVPWEQFGFSVVKICSEGQEIIDYIENNEVHVILTDIKMSGMSGIDIAKYVFENRLNIKVILISAYDDFEFAKKRLNIMHLIIY